MRKIVIIITLLLFNFCIVYAKIKDKNLDKVDIKLKEDELGIAVITLEGSTSLILKYQDKYIFYLVDYINDIDLDTNIKVFTDNVYNSYMAKNYAYDAQILKEKSIGDLTLKPDQISDDVLLTKDINAILYRTDLDEGYLDYIDTFWVDKYRLTNQNYIVITLGDDFIIDSISK